MSPAAPNTTKDGSAIAGSDFTRLHITPLDPELFTVLVPASLRGSARNISYHTIETFPEKRYGYLELPAMEAEKLKKKLNGAVLKGTKLKIEKARPAKKPVAEMDAEAEEAESSKANKKDKKRNKKSKDDDLPTEPKKRKRDEEVIEGVLLTDRKVKRGWTDTDDHKKERRSKKDKGDKDKDKKDKKEKKKRIKSKYTDEEECLIRTKLPPNAVGNVPHDDEDGTKRKKKKGNAREVTVHEFERTTKFPSFLKESGSEEASQSATEFVEGKGWVDGEGNVVQEVKERPSKKAKAKAKVKVPPKVVEEEEDDDSTSSSGSSTSSSGDSDSENDLPTLQKPLESREKDTPLKDGKKSRSRESPRPVSSSSARSLTIKIPPPETPPAAKVHPLEALYKRPKPDGTVTQTPSQEPQPFSFFGANDNEEAENDAPSSQMSIAMPMTPFTQQDFEWRNVRSAAPTPDTAHPSRMRNFWAPPEGDDDVAEEYDEEEEEGGQAGESAAAPGSSDFQKWFWENRRDLNRSWMNRRKTAAKERRYRENKARASGSV